MEVSLWDTDMRFNAGVLSFGVLWSGRRRLPENGHQTSGMSPFKMCSQLHTAQVTSEESSWDVCASMLERAYVCAPVQVPEQQGTWAQ